MIAIRKNEVLAAMCVGIVACAIAVVIGLSGCNGQGQAGSAQPANPQAATTPAATVAKTEKTAPVVAEVAPIQTTETTSPAAVDSEIEKLNSVHKESQFAYETMGDSTKAASNRIRLKIETSGIWSLDDDEVIFTLNNASYFAPYVVEGLGQNKGAEGISNAAAKLNMTTARDLWRIYKLLADERTALIFFCKQDRQKAIYYWQALRHPQGNIRWHS